jgi:hypothetical protein
LDGIEVAVGIDRAGEVAQARHTESGFCSARVRGFQIRVIGRRVEKRANANPVRCLLTLTLHHRWRIPLERALIAVDPDGAAFAGRALVADVDAVAAVVLPYRY